MNPQLQINLSPKARALLAAAPAWPIALRSEIAKAMDKQNELTTGYIQRHKLSRRAPMMGPKTTLGVVTNRLRLSARPTKAVVTADTILSSIGTNVKYGGVHEDGFSGTVKVRAFTRRQHTNDIVRGSSDRRGFAARQAKERLSASGIARVKAHTRRVHIPARHMFRSGIEERLPRYSSAISRAVVQVLTPQGGGAAQ